MLQAGASLLIIGGLFFFLAGTVGLLRFPDVFSRMHATTKCDTVGAGMVLLGLFMAGGDFMMRSKLIIIIAFLWLTNPTATHYMSRAVYRSQKKVE